MAEELQAADVEVVDLAALPYRPVGVPWWLKLGAALVAGLVAGAGAATLLDARNRSIRGPEELAQIIPARGLGIIPRVEEAVGVGPGRAVLRALRDGRTTSNGLPHEVVRDSPSASVGTEAFRLLYSSLTFGWGERQRIILVTSTAPQEGKTLIASNLAVTFAREGAQVLLVDCDVRRPRLHKMFRVPRSPGLMDLLVASVPPPPSQAPLIHVDEPPLRHGYSLFGALERPPEVAPEAVVRSTPPPTPPPPAVPATQPLSAWERPKAIRSTSIRGLWVLPCGAMPANPAETLRAGGVRRVLREIAEHYDLIVIDTPPVLATGDAAILAPLADGVLLVVRAGQTEREPAERAYDQLTAAGATVVGTVLNDPEEEVGRYRTLYYSYDYQATSD
jgi:Mrp family chromosome partitioning ATPase